MITNLSGNKRGKREQWRQIYPIEGNSRSWNFIGKDEGE